ncbi:MAG: diacylglycerol/polyprenol kinase family protein [Cyanobacteria bacterium P01_H01_bin.15]
MVYLGLLVGLAEALNRLRSQEPETTRKLVHIGTGNVILLAWGLQIPAWVGILAGILAAGLALVSYVVPLLPSINSVGRKSLGTFFYAVSMGILVGTFWSLHAPEFAAIGILVMAWGDGLAALVGQRFGRHQYHIFGAQKSWEGSATMALASFGVIALILSLTHGLTLGSFVISGLVAMMAAGLEAISVWGGIDNLSVPVGSAFVCFYLSQWLLLTG